MKKDGATKTIGGCCNFILTLIIAICQKNLKITKIKNKRKQDLTMCFACGSIGLPSGNARVKIGGNKNVIKRIIKATTVY